MALASAFSIRITKKFMHFYKGRAVFLWLKVPNRNFAANPATPSGFHDHGFFGKRSI